MAENGFEAELLQLQREQVKMLRFLALREIRRSIDENLKSDQHKLVYENSTGKSMREVGALSGISHATVQSLWEKWAPMGIVTEVEGQKGRYERLCSLRSVGIEVPVSKSAVAKPETLPAPQGAP